MNIRAYILLCMSKLVIDCISNVSIFAKLLVFVFMLLR